MEETLKELNLSENEINVYLTLLKTNLSSANRIAKLSGIKRSTTYDTLSSLVSKGFAKMSSKNSIKYFLALEPLKLLDFIDRKRERIEKIIPKLESIQGIKQEKTGVTFFEGEKGVKTVLNDIIEKKPKDLIFIGSRKMAKIPLKYYPENFVNKRVEENIKIKGILAEEDKKDNFISRTNAKRISSFSYSKKLNNSSANIFIYENKVSFITNLEDPVGVLIYNQEIADQMKKIFLWLDKKNKNRTKK